MQVSAHLSAVTEGALAAVGSGRFSSAGFTELKLRIDTYGADLVAEALRIAQRHQADVVSPAYVQQASGYLVARGRNRKFTLLGSLGAILLGAALSSFLEVAWEREISSVQLLVSGLLGAAGAFMVALQFARE